MTLPHDPYMDQVHAHLSDLGIFPTGFRTDEPEGAELDAVFALPDHAVAEDEWPDGVYLSWTSSDGWALTDTGSSRTAYPLDIDPYSHPAAVAAITRARLAGQPDPEDIPTTWTLRAETETAVDSWRRQPQE